jgi:YfiH family protein
LAGFPELQHAVFTRKGGVSGRPFDSLNTSFGVGDDSVAVERNREIVRACFEGANLAYCRQVHGRRVVRVPVATGSAGDGRPPVGDALITDTPGTALVIQVADCQAVLLYDPVTRAAANIHSGWRGSTANIIGRTVAAMNRHFGTNPSDLHAGIGPSLGPCCAEFVNYREEIPRQYWAYKDAADRFDFWALSVDQLRAAGVPAEQIQSDGRCTRCRTDRFFSYRGENTTGRFAVVIGLRGTGRGAIRRPDKAVPAVARGRQSRSRP